MRAKIEVWKMVIEGLRAREYGEGSVIQNKLETWRYWHKTDRQDGHFILLSACKPWIRRCRAERHQWLLKAAKYGDGTPIATTLPF